MWLYDIEQEVQRDATIDPVGRSAAVEELRRIGDRDVAKLCAESAAITMRPDARDEAYQRALRNAARATQLAPWSAYCIGVHGMARYRTGDYAGALETLERAAAQGRSRHGWNCHSR